jgi:uncharacterized membrane protein
MRRPLAAAIAIFVCVMTALALVRWQVWSYGNDTGTFAQIILHAFSGFTDGPERGTHFRFHFSPILAVLWPLVALTRSALSIQIAQVILIACSAIPLAAIARTYAGEEWGTRVGILALLYPPLIANAFNEFHELAFFPVLALALVWAADRASWLWFALFAIAAVLVREDVCVQLVVIGVVFGIIGIMKGRTQERGLLAGEPIEPERLTVAGFTLAILSAAMLAWYTYGIVPHVGGWSPTHFYRYSFANGPLQTALALFTHPVQFAHAIFTLGRLTYLLEAFAPLVFLPLFTRWSWLSLPGFAVVLLANNPYVWRMGDHYALLWAPWLLLAAAWVLARVRSVRWWGAGIAVCIIVLIVFDPMHPAHYLKHEPYQQSANVERAFACVPNNAQIETHDEWFAHLAARYPNATNMTGNAAQFPGYIVYSTDWGNASVREHLLPLIAAARAAGRYRVLCTFGNVTVLKPTGAAE